MSGTTTIDQTTEISSIYVDGNVIVERDSGTPPDQPVVVGFNTSALNLDLLTTFTVQDGATLQIDGLVNVQTGNTFVIGSGGTLELGAGISAAVINDIVFGAGTVGGVLVVDSGTDVNLLDGIAGFAKGDSIDFTGTAAPLSSHSYTDSFDGTATNFTIALVGGGTETFALAGDLTSNSFALSGQDGALVFTDTACFAPGTRILTEAGELPVETLAPGDIAILADGTPSRITFIGRRFYDLRRHPNPQNIRPIRIAAGALADGIPARPLTLSPDHALFLDGVLVQAKDLVDGIAIAADHTVQTIRYYHVELESHGILLAEGAAAESYLDTGHRGIFENTTAPLILHPDLMQIRREAESIAPLCHDGEKLSQIRAALHVRKLALGLAITQATDIALIINGQTLIPIADNMSHITFAIPEGADEATIRTAGFVPAMFDPASNDRRRLGLALTGLIIDGASLPLSSLLHPASLHPSNTGDPHGWTFPEFRLRLPRGTQTLTLEIAARPKTWKSPCIAA